ncbi:MAG: AzlD domain-containing protein [Eubacteriales bacterium]
MNIQEILIVVVVALVTMFLRFLPFIVMSGKQKTPAVISYLGIVLPFSIMGMLVVYCLKDIYIIEYPYGIPEIIAIGLVAGIHIWKRNTLLSILMGTVSYMVLVQMIFV